MISPGRRRRTAGRFANVDGIPFRMPVGTRGSPALLAAYPIDPEGARAVLPRELHPCRIRGRGLLLIAVVDYQDTTIGTYVEFCIGVLCTRGDRPAPPLLPLLLGPVFGTGVYIYDLPVSTEISVKGGLGIWGMPKRRASLDFVVGDTTVSSQYDLDGQLVMRIDVPRPALTRLPLRFNGVGYGCFRGMLAKSSISMRGRMGVTFGGGPGGRLLLGDHERVAWMKQLDIGSRPLVTAFVPAMRGVLDDHVETWFLTSDTVPGPPEDGLESVVGLGLGQGRLPPPDRVRSDRLLRAPGPREYAGSG
ncbi:acetoacetate decarboxylase family protein [Planomonospora sp. ID67723]|uniref:acetoacetate decarboxylase family protein n=1 Tax=Planomonospora sp. ID67723 TaxID=2738134 RepID=UPI0018C414C0|nr:acetoacetate decarboxylase family protein [Planomonospora sp. ID67723]MBG0832626.1 acetoacetate decarboxylase family protein [Planomonospora sp. ID67723]